MNFLLQFSQKHKMKFLMKFIENTLIIINYICKLNIKMRDAKMRSLFFFEKIERFSMNTTE